MSNPTFWIIIIALIFLLTSVISILKYNKLSKGHSAYVNDMIRLVFNHKDTISKLNLQLNELADKDKSSSEKTVRLEGIIEEKDRMYRKLTEVNEASLSSLAALYADHQTLQYELTEKYYAKKTSWLNKVNEKAIKIRELKNQTREHITRLKIMEYKYAYLLSIFPELEVFSDNIESLLEFNRESKKSLDEISEDFDRTAYFLSKDEYRNLNEEQRNQLALDRYIKGGSKSNWQLGRDYEMYIGYVFEKQGYKTEYFGIENGINDLGRDIIARKNNVTRIIQCKYWSKEKVIHEKHVAQLYGTTVQYILLNKYSSPDSIVIPMLVTSTQLSNTAKIFAEYLKVEFMENASLGEYPRIKCNLNRDEYGETKIYHLPFDQMYDYTKISKKGEIYAITVKEAMEHGFRRAKKWYGGSG